MKASIVLSLVGVFTVAAALPTTTSAHRVVSSSAHRKLNEEDSDWRDQLLPAASSDDYGHAVTDEESVSGSQPRMKVSPELQAVMDGRSSSSSKSLKGKGKSKKNSKSMKGKGHHHAHPVMDESDDDNDSANDIDDSTEDSYDDDAVRSKGLNKKQSKSGSDHEEAACYYTGGIWIGNKCHGPSKRGSKLHKLAESNSPSPHVFPPSYLSPQAYDQAPPPSAKSPSPPTIPIPTYFTPRPTQVPVPSSPVSAPVRPVYEQLMSPVTGAPAAAAPEMTAPTVADQANTSSPISVVAPTTSAPITSVPAVAVTVSPVVASFPTSAPVLEIAERTPAYTVKTVATNHVLLRIVGAFNPSTQEETFFEVVRTNFAPYSRAIIGDMLLTLEMTQEFVQQQQSAAKTVESAVHTSWSEINASFHLGSDDKEAMDAFTAETAFGILLGFFQAPYLQRLIDRLGEAGIAVTDIQIHDAFPDGSDSSTTKDNEVAGSSAQPRSSGTSSSNNRAAVIAGLVSGFIVLLVICAVLVAYKRRQRYNAIFDEKASQTGAHSYSDMYTGTQGQGDIIEPTESASNVKPAALQVRNKRERAAKLGVSSNSTISSYHSSGTSTAQKAGVTAREEMANSLVPFEDGTYSEPSVAHVSLDGDTSVGSLDPANPEFGLYLTDGLAPPSPQWSVGVGNFSSTTSQYTTQDEYATARRRWHDEANDLDLIALPNHRSDRAYASPYYDNQSAEDSESSEGNTNGMYSV